MFVGMSETVLIGVPISMGLSLVKESQIQSKVFSTTFFLLFYTF